MVLVGNPETFAIESHISTAYQRPSLLGLGYFVVHLGSRTYGNRSEQATVLACSLDHVRARIRMRGLHQGAFERDQAALNVALLVEEALYGQGGSHTHERIGTDIYAKELLLAPDGDQAFDDGSRIVQFDIDGGANVRLVAYVADESGVVESTVRGVVITSSEFYGILEEWVSLFEEEWGRMPKTSEAFGV